MGASERIRLSLTVLRLAKKVSGLSSSSDRIRALLEGLCGLVEAPAAMLVTGTATGTPPGRFDDVECIGFINAASRAEALELVRRAWKRGNGALHNGNGSVVSIQPAPTPRFREALALLRPQPFSQAEAEWVHQLHGETAWLRGQPPAMAALTHRQREVLERLLAGDSEAEIARTLGLSPHTVRDHVKAIYQALGVHSRMELAGRMNGNGAEEKK